MKNPKIKTVEDIVLFMLYILYARTQSLTKYVRVLRGEVVGWVLPCPPSLPTRGRRRGTRDNPYTRQSILRPKLDNH
jgi:hypothetical protein